VTAPRVQTISVPTPFRVGPVNCHLLVADRLTLVDAGPHDSPSLTAVERGLEAVGYRIDDVELLLITHQHFDHFGAAAALQERGVRVGVLERLAPVLASFPAYQEADDRFAHAVTLAHGVEQTIATELAQLSGSYRRYGRLVNADIVLSDGDEIDLGDIALRVCHRPGHSPTDTLFVHEPSGVAFVGDHLLAHISANPVLHRPVDRDAGPHDRPRPLVAYLDSLRSTAAMNLTIAYTGHGPPVTDHRSLAERRIREHEERKFEIFDLISDGATTALDVAGALWPALPADETYLALSEVLGHVDLLAREGFVVEAAAGERIRLEAVAAVAARARPHPRWRT
jgi:glyoxylase-like metal-dependent hydrolase (beta-lactamase superfamily II)